MRKVIAYIRVSRVGGREGDSFISPELQREAIERECQRSDLEVIDTLTELDRSGGDNTRPLWNEAIERIERGEAQGLIVWNLSRFSRSLPDALKAIQRIENAGGQLYSASGDAGDDSPTGRYTRNNFLNLAQMERERAAHGLDAAKASAVARGIHIASYVPFGYVRNPVTRIYEIDPSTAPIVVGMFERRAKGHAWASIARWITEQGYETNPQTVQTRVKNRAYLGYAYSGEKENRNAHPAIVSKKLFDDANSIKGFKFRGDGKLSANMALLGIVRCENCHRLLSPVSARSRPRKDGGKPSETPGYYCKKATCEAKGYANAAALDSLIIPWLLMVFDVENLTVEPDSRGDLAEAIKTLSEAEYDFEQVAGDKEYRRIVGMARYNRELEALAEAVTEARIALEMVEQAASPQAVSVRELWDGWTMQSRREWLNRVVETLTVRKSENRGDPLGPRVTIELRGIGINPVHGFTPLRDFLAASGHASTAARALL